MEDIHNKYWDYEILGKFLVWSVLNSAAGNTNICRDEIADFISVWYLGFTFGGYQELDEEWPEFKDFVERHC